MTDSRIGRPSSDECPEFYYSYVSQVPDGDILSILARGVEETCRLLGPIDEARGDSRYAPGKWSIKELLGHLVDIEWILNYRALRISRGQNPALSGIDQDELVRGACSGERSLASLFLELQGLRAAGIEMYRAMTPEMLLRRGTASGFPFTVRVFPWVVAGHEIHHRKVLREKYRI